MSDKSDMQYAIDMIESLSASRARMEFDLLSRIKEIKSLKEQLTAKSLVIASIPDHPFAAVGTFAWACERMLERKKVRRKNWPGGVFWDARRGAIFSSRGYDPAIGVDDLSATDWEVVE